MVRVASFALLALFVFATVTFAAPQASQNSGPTSPSEAAPAPVGATVAPTEDFVYGPITSRDPEVRAQVKKLYLDQYNLDVATKAQLDELVASLQTETDPDFRTQLQNQMIVAKQELQLQAMELGLQIARLNGDEARVADYEKALDRILHPEKYMPATLDPSIAKERARSMGLDN